MKLFLGSIVDREEAVLSPYQVLTPDSMLHTPRPDNLEHHNQVSGNQMFNPSQDLYLEPVVETSEQVGELHDENLIKKKENGIRNMGRGKGVKRLSGSDETFDEIAFSSQPPNKKGTNVCPKKARSKKGKNR